MSNKNFYGLNKANSKIPWKNKGPEKPKTFAPPCSKTYYEVLLMKQLLCEDKQISEKNKTDTSETELYIFG